MMAVPSEEPQGAKAQQIMKAARAVFMEAGYGAASMDAIARAAGVSKATLYTHFSGKEELFAAMIGGECRRHAHVLSAPDIDQLDIRDALARIGRDFMAFVLSPDAMKIHRIVVAEAGRFPELGRAFYRSGPDVVLTRLAAYLAGATERGLLAVPDPRLAAEQFIGMVRGVCHLRLMLGVTEDGGAEIARTVDGAVDMFLRAYAPRS